MRLRTLSLTTTASVLLAVGAVLCVGALWNAYIHRLGDSAEYLCIVGSVPQGVNKPLDEFNEGSRVEGRWTVWPMGRECTWHSTVSDRTVVYHSGGWQPTWLMLLGMTLSGAGTCVALQSRRPSADALLP